MSLFQTILESIENPNHAGSQQDLHGLLNLAQLLPGVEGAEQQVQPILGVLGSHLQDALNQQQQTGGTAEQKAKHLFMCMHSLLTLTLKVLTDVLMAVLKLLKSW